MYIDPSFQVMPEEMTALNLKAFLQINFDWCGCWEEDAYVELLRLLEWIDADDRPLYGTLYPAHKGVFYLLVGHLENLDLVRHGTSARVPNLTGDGRQLLEAMRKYDAEDIEAAEGEAFDGRRY